MLYVLLMHEQEAAAAVRSPGEDEAIMREHLQLAEAIGGCYRGCAAFEPTRTATTVRVRTGKTLISDGPFAATTEQLGGCYVIEARDLDQAIAIAARVPTARTGSVEVRPIRTLNGGPRTED